jgi:hypothetical protein
VLRLTTRHALRLLAALETTAWRVYLRLAFDEPGDVRVWPLVRAAFFNTEPGFQLALSSAWRADDAQHVAVQLRHRQPAHLRGRLLLVGYENDDMHVALEQGASRATMRELCALLALCGAGHARLGAAAVAARRLVWGDGDHALGVRVARMLVG